MSEIEVPASGCPMIRIGDPLWTKPVHCATQPVVPTNEGKEFETMVRAVVKDKEAEIDITAYKGDVTNNFLLASRNVHLTTRKHYAEMMTNVGANVYPMMLLSDADEGLPGGIGGMITVYKRDLTYERYVPTPHEYEILKNLSHMSIGVFTVVSPWFRCPGSLEITNCLTYLDQVKIAQNALKDEVFIKPDLRKTATAMYAIVEKHLKKWINQTSCTIAEFEQFAEDMNEYVPNNIIQAATIQAKAFYPALKKVKEDLGKEEWEKLYVVVPTVWPVSGINPRVEILSRLMTPDQMNTHVFCMDNLDNMSKYRETLGRIIGDRCSANLILGTKDHSRKEMLYALATRQDLMANACDNAMKEIVPERHVHEDRHQDKSKIAP